MGASLTGEFHTCQAFWPDTELEGPVGGSASPAGLDDQGPFLEAPWQLGFGVLVMDKHEALAGNSPELADSGLLISWHSDSRQPGSQKRP